ncbi:MAG: tRNA epoxyqueuosine(34) reductase QueG [Candidatus Gracilibacteria bacterium]
MKNRIRAYAISQGFDLVGFSSTRLETKHLLAFNAWLKKGYEGSMTYMQKKELRENILKLLPQAKSVISLAMNYYNKQSPLKKNHGRVARYAYGRDYHKIIPKKLKAVEEFITSIAPHATTKAYVDTGPVLERAYAEQSGLGFIGKNTCLITPQLGSWVFLAEIITTLPLIPDQKLLNTPKPFAACGGCRKCIDACPTKAIVAPGVIDATKCISYLTIENRNEIPKPLAKIIKKTRLLYGCDICQEVCPFNSKAKPTPHKELLVPKIAGDQLAISAVLSIKTAPNFIKLFAGSPLTRAKHAGLQRNAAVLTKR